MSFKCIENQYNYWFHIQFSSTVICCCKQTNKVAFMHLCESILVNTDINLYQQNVQNSMLTLCHFNLVMSWSVSVLFCFHLQLAWREFPPAVKLSCIGINLSDYLRTAMPIMSDYSPHVPSAILLTLMILFSVLVRVLVCPRCIHSLVS